MSRESYAQVRWITFRPYSHKKVPSKEGTRSDTFSEPDGSEAERISSA